MPLVYDDRVIGLITAGDLEGRVYNTYHINLLNLFSINAASALQNAILYQKDSQVLEELIQTKTYLESVLEHLEDHRNLALIGLVYGETIHYAKNKLGMADTIASNIIQGRYGDVSVDIKQNLKKVIDNIRDYFKVLGDMQRKAIDMPSPLPVNIHTVIEQVISSKRIGNNIMINLSYKAYDPMIFAPERQLRQVFFVIIQNSLDAMADRRGTLELRTQTVRQDDKSFIKVSISDMGLASLITSY